MISEFFIKRPIFATVMALVLVLAGVLAIDFLPVAQYPNITPPTIQVTALYPGANAETLAKTVALPIEQQVNGVTGMLYMSSTSSSSGQYTLTVTFGVGTDVNMAEVHVQNRVSLAEATLPEAVMEQGITVSKQSPNIMLIASLVSTDSLYDALYLSNYATLQLLDPLKRLPGVGSVQIFGAGDYSMRIWLDPEKMRLRQVTPQEVYAAIQSQNMEVSAGAVGQDFNQSSGAPFEYTLNVEGRLTSEQEFGNIIIRSEGLGKILRLKDIARVQRGAVSYGTVSQLDGKPTAVLAIYQRPGSNSLAVAKSVRKELKQLANRFPKGVDYQITLDTTDVIRDSIKEVLTTLVLTILLVVLVIFLFLQNYRAVLIPCITIPVSLIGTVAIMWILGYSINTLTLFGLILAVAIVVDDAIVVVENAERKLSEQVLTPKKVVTEAMQEISGPIVGVVLVLLAVFIPTIFISGITGELYKQFAVTVASATVISGLSALSLIPALCAEFLRPTEKHESGFFKAFNTLFNKVQAVYERVVKFLLNHALVTLISFFCFVASALYLFTTWPTTFIPTEDDGYFIIAVQLPPAASLDRTVAIDQQLQGLLEDIPEIQNFVSIAGFSLLGNAEQTNSSTFFVILKPWSERKGKRQSATAIVNRINEQAYGIEGAMIFAVIPPPIPGLGNTGGLQLQLQDVNNLGAQQLQLAVQEIVEHYKEKPAIANVNSQFQANVPQYFLDIDRDQVKFYGLTLKDVFEVLSFNMGATYVNEYVEYGHIYQVRIESQQRMQENIDDVMKLTVENDKGDLVPFSSFTTVRLILGQDQVDRYNMYETAAINCIVMPGKSTGQGIAQMESLIQEQLQGSFGYEWTSIAYQETQAGNTTSIILMLALLVAFLVLAALYESWTSPIAALIGLPVALLGAMIGCYVMGTPVSVYTQIGIILLIALSAKNGILIVEFSRDYRAKGNSIRDAALEAGRVRLRPILMTSLAFVFGVMPLLFASGAGAQSRIALGAGVVFGIAVNTFLATLYIPSFYEWMQRIQERWFSKPSA